jgi:hypothetical protein
MPQQNGCLIIADISGYTAFLTQAELEHAEDIMRSLFDTLLKHMGPPLIISKLEGDAIFAYAQEGSFLQGQTLLEAIENLYCVFAGTLEQMHRNTTCTCKACQLIPTLDLKFLLHHGTFILSTIGGREELSGPDVILIHRLLKSHITEETGLKAYAFFTQNCAEAMGLGQLADEMRPHAETYEHLGNVTGFAHDMHAVWAREREHRRVVVEPEAAWFEVPCDLPLPPALAWEYLTKPEYAQQWFEAETLEITGYGGGRRGVGNVLHCAHGKEVSLNTIMDWRPFEYITYEMKMPLNLTCRWMTRLTPTEHGTRVSWYFGKPVGSGSLHSRLAALMGLAMKGMMKKMLEHNPPILSRMVEADLAAGKIVVVPVQGESKTSQ